MRPNLDQIYREHAASLIARMVRASGGRVDWAETAVHDAFTRAAAGFVDDPPKDPVAWLYRVARNRLTDLARHERVQLDAGSELAESDGGAAPPAALLAGEWDDELLKMIVAACHPDLTPDERVALALRILCGLSRASIATIFRAEEETIKKRLTNAKKKLRTVSSIDPPVPAVARGRIDVAMRVLYAVFTEGHKPRSGQATLRIALCAEAIRLAEVLRRKIDRPDLDALLALMKLSAARLPARADGIVLLEHQDRTLWDARLIDEGLQHLKRSAAGDEVTAYHHEATIAACHCLARDFERTDWARILKAYDALLAESPSPVLAVGRAVAIGYHHGFEQGLQVLQAMPRSEIVGYLPYHAALGSMAERSGDTETAASAFTVAQNLSQTPADRAFFEARVASVRRLLDLQ